MIKNGIEIEEVMPLLEGLPSIRERIEHLWRHSFTAYRNLGNIWPSVQPNCRGTAIHAVGAEELFLQGREVAMNGVIVPLKAEKDDLFILPEGFDSPGSIKSKPAREFLEGRCSKLKELVPGAIITTRGNNLRGEYRDPLHMMVYLGDASKTSYLFHQLGPGQGFKFNTMKDLARRIVSEDMSAYIVGF